MKDLYRVLGLLPTAEPEVIKAAYKALAQKYHPDKHPDKKLLYNEIMAELNLAHATLSHAKRRKEYDATWKSFVTKQTGHPTTPQSHAEPSSNASDHRHQNTDPLAKHATVLSHLASNKVDEFQMMHLYEELFGNALTLESGWTNRYVHTLNGRQVRYSFSELKELIIEKLKSS